MRVYCEFACNFHIYLYISHYLSAFGRKIHIDITQWQRAWHIATNDRTITFFAHIVIAIVALCIYTSGIYDFWTKFIVASIWTISRYCQDVQKEIYDTLFLQLMMVGWISTIALIANFLCLERIIVRLACTKGRVFFFTCEMTLTSIKSVVNEMMLIAGSKQSNNMYA